MAAKLDWDRVAKAMVDGAVRHMKAQLEPLEARIRELESGALHDAGVWDSAKEYRSGALVSYRGSGWIAKAGSKGVKPGSADGLWRLAIKKEIARDE
jgi:hypothetical protein